MRHRRRRGGVAVSASAWMVLVAAARTTGTRVAATAIARASAVTATTVRSAGGWELTDPRSPALGWISAGAVSQPAARPVPAAAIPSTRYSARWTTAIMAGPAPTALSIPTRRRRPTTRPATMPATPATARIVSSQLPISRASCARATGLPSSSAMSCQVVSMSASARSGAAGTVSMNAAPAAGSASLRFRVYDSGASPASAAMSPGRPRPGRRARTWGCPGSATRRTGT